MIDFSSKQLKAGRKLRNITKHLTNCAEEAIPCAIAAPEVMRLVDRLCRELRGAALCVLQDAIQNACEADQHRTCTATEARGHLADALNVTERTVLRGQAEAPRRHAVASKIRIGARRPVVPRPRTGNARRTG